jgi:hypothetical protein
MKEKESQLLFIVVLKILSSKILTAHRVALFLHPSHSCSILRLLLRATSANVSLSFWKHVMITCRAQSSGHLPVMAPNMPVTSALQISPSHWRSVLNNSRERLLQTRFACWSWKERHRVQLRLCLLARSNVRTRTCDRLQLACRSPN